MFKNIFELAEFEWGELYEIKPLSHSFIPGCCTDGVEYQNVDDFPEAVNKCAKILNRYGIKFLKSLENPENDEHFLRNEYFRQEDYYLLYEKHDLLAEKFITENHVDMTNIIIDDAFCIMRDYILKKRVEPFAKSRDSFVELAAFYGYILNKKCHCHWELIDFKTYSVCDLVYDSNKVQSLPITRKIYFAWKGIMDELDELKELNILNTA